MKELEERFQAAHKCARCGNPFYHVGDAVRLGDHDYYHLLCAIAILEEMRTAKAAQAEQEARRHLDEL